MSTEPQPKKSLKGRVLVATPQLVDPNFAQTLVYVAEHTPEGALGFVVNRPIGKTLREVAEAASLTPPLAELRIYCGGPVQPRQLLLVVFEPGNNKAPVDCRLGLPPEQVEAHIASGKSWVRAFAGYSGWGEGQLEHEIRDKAWRICPADPTLFREHLTQGLWSVYISGDTRWRKLLDKLPPEPDAN